MKTFKNLVFKAHPNGYAEIQAEMNFPNGYGVSVIQGGGAYSGEGTYELAVTEGGSATRGGSICYSTPIAPDVLGFRTVSQVTQLMKDVQALEAN